MRLLRGLLGALYWLLASLIGLVGVIACVTIILLPVGFIFLRLARKLYTRAVALMLPRALSHPLDEAQRGSRRSTPKAADKVEPPKKAKQLSRRAKKKAKDKARKARKKMKALT